MHIYGVCCLFKLSFMRGGQMWSGQARSALAGRPTLRREQVQFVLRQLMEEEVTARDFLFVYVHAKHDAGGYTSCRG